MTRRILTALAAIGGLTVLVAAFVALYSLRGQAIGSLTRAQTDGASPITGAQPAPADVKDDAAADEADDDSVEGLADVVFTAIGGPDGAGEMAAAARLDIVEEPGVVVSALVKDGAAVKAGVKRGDILLAVGDQRINDMRDLTKALEGKKAGDSVAITVRHGDAERKLTATLGDQALLGILPCGPGTGAMRAIRVVGGPGAHQGAFVESVVAEGPAAKAGLKETDLITAVDGKAIDKDNDLASLIAAHKPGETVTLSVARRQELSRDEASPDEVKIEIKIDPVEIKVVLGENPEKAGAAYLGLRFHPGGPMFWHEGMPGMPPMPAMPAMPGQDGAAPTHGGVFSFKHKLGGDDEGPAGGDVMFFHAAGADGEAQTGGAATAGARFEMRLKGGDDVVMPAAPLSQDI